MSSGPVAGGRVRLGHAGRFGLLVAAAVPLVTGCGAPEGVPQWKDAAPAGAAPTVIGSAPALSGPAVAGGTAGATAGPAGAAAGAEPGREAASTEPGGEAADAEPGREAAGAEPGREAAGAEPGREAAGDRFVAAVRERLPELALDRRPEEITELGGEACAGLAAGRQRAAVAETLQGYGVTAREARELVAFASSGLCTT